jgi:threonyl-tRNA synthetase
VYRALEELIRELDARYGYEEVRSPLTGTTACGSARGTPASSPTRWSPSTSNARQAALKPMNCPGHAELFAHRPRSYRELPLRIAELGHVHRAEQSGERNGLLRARAFVIDDAHVFCRADQVADELVRCLEMVRRVWERLGAR